jgi:hypothetical protein
LGRQRDLAFLVLVSRIRIPDVEHR